MIFSFVYAVFAMFTFHILVVYGGWLFKNLLFESVLICRAETSGLVKRIKALSCSIIIFHFARYQNRFFAVVGRYFDR